MSDKKWKVRLTDEVVEKIRELLKTHFGEGARAWIFGSRANLSAKGGDIDIYVEVEDYRGIFGKKLNFLVDLEKVIGEQKVDVVIKPSGCNEPISLEAKGKGVKIL